MGSEQHHPLLNVLRNATEHPDQFLDIDAQNLDYEVELIFLKGLIVSFCQSWRNVSLTRQEEEILGCSQSYPISRLEGFFSYADNPENRNPFPLLVLILVKRKDARILPAIAALPDAYRKRLRTFINGLSRSLAILAILDNIAVAGKFSTWS
jgi:hypothetical protein